jgi:glutathione-regulated potassium-efflux system ancillary protein KefG
MPKILILFAHPRFETSRANLALVNQIPQTDAITFHDLYEKYPDFNIDVESEKKLLLAHEIVIWHHPFYWYSCPPLLKQWIDIVLEFGWAYGPGGIFLKDKLIFNCITSGGMREVYSSEGHNRFTVREFLAPFDQTAHLCKMTYLPPFAIQGTHRLSDNQLSDKAIQYKSLLERLMKGDLILKEINEHSFLNDWLTSKENF